MIYGKLTRIVCRTPKGLLTAYRRFSRVWKGLCQVGKPVLRRLDTLSASYGCTESVCQLFLRKYSTTWSAMLRIPFTDGWPYCLSIFFSCRYSMP